MPGRVVVVVDSRRSLADEEPIVIVRVRPFERDASVPHDQHAVDVPVPAGDKLLIERLERTGFEPERFGRRGGPPSGRPRCRRLRNGVTGDRDETNDDREQGPLEPRHKPRILDAAHRRANLTLIHAGWTRRTRRNGELQRNRETEIFDASLFLCCSVRPFLGARRVSVQPDHLKLATDNLPHAHAPDEFDRHGI
jgi:hypothetical protein